MPEWPWLAWGVRHGQEEEEEDRQIRMRKPQIYTQLKDKHRTPGGPRKPPGLLEKEKGKMMGPLNMKRNQMSVN